MHRPARLLLALAILLAPATLHAQNPDPTLAFGSGTNPSGPWRFGSKLISSPLGTFTDLTVYSTTTNFARWSDGSFYGGVYYQGDLLVGGGNISMHPFQDGRMATLRFVAPTAGSYGFAGSFGDGDVTSTDVYIGWNNSSLLFSGYVSDGNPPLNFGLTLTLTPGEYVDFMVGYGGNGYDYDTTVLVLNPQVVTTTPEPASLVLVTTGLLGLFAVRRRRR